MSDLIDRQAAIDTLDKHLRTTDVPVSYPGIISALTEWLNELPSAQADSKETSSTHKALDTISRQAVIEINRSYHGQMPNEVNHRIWKEINELPSVQPETPMHIGWICPVCGRGLSPLTSVCPCNNGKGWEITC